MLDELLKDEELGRIMFAEFLNQNGCNTGVDTEKAFEDWRCRCMPVPPEQLAQLEPDEKMVILKDVLDKEDDNMEEVPTTIRELEEKRNCERLAEPEYYAGNGLSPLEAFKRGLLSREETIGFIKGNIIKYVTRAGKKNNASEDMVKAIDYCGHLKRLYEHEMRNKPHLEADLAPIDFNEDTAKQAKETMIKALESIDKVKE